MPHFEDIKRIRDFYPNMSEMEHGHLLELQDSLKTIIMDGNVVTQSSTGELLGYTAMYESVFVNNWIAQFALDEVNGKQYFNFKAWADITDSFRNGVIVVEDGTNTPMFIIPSFASPIVTNDESRTLSWYAGKAAEAKFIPDDVTKDQIIKGFAERVKEILAGNATEGYTKLVPDWVYARNGIVPVAMKAMIYIRDVYGTVDDEEVFKKAEAIMRKHYTGEIVSEVEKEFIWGLTNNEFIFDLNQTDAGNKEPDQPLVEEEDDGWHD